MTLIINKEEYVNKTFRLDKDLVDTMFRICQDKNISMNRFVDIAIKYAISNLADNNVEFKKNGEAEACRGENKTYYCNLNRE